MLLKGLHKGALLILDYIVTYSTEKVDIRRGVNFEHSFVLHTQ